MILISEKTYIVAVAAAVVVAFEVVSVSMAVVYAVLSGVWTGAWGQQLNERWTELLVLTGAMSGVRAATVEFGQGFALTAEAALSLAVACCSVGSQHWSLVVCDL